VVDDDEGGDEGGDGSNAHVEDEAGRRKEAAPAGFRQERDGDSRCCKK